MYPLCLPTALSRIQGSTDYISHSGSKKKGKQYDHPFRSNGVLPRRHLSVPHRQHQIGHLDPITSNQIANHYRWCGCVGHISDDRTSLLPSKRVCAGAVVVITTVKTIADG
ncbi:hypothetical protein AVEN_59214-1 [Araneus ventricosus]|uniref:Uncharacterized protein n=1 Tax=Araneus ventricosus TaxID=182803 RepID=A0A4Y2UQB2_ARAVE|nr:hypothetical protein AVEN_59214-1 [Araneus ventricosus]